MRKSILIVITISLMLSMFLISCAPKVPVEDTNTAEVSTSEKEYKVAAVFPGVITDTDYNTIAYLGMTALKEKMGVEIAYSEAVAVPDVERVMREYIDGGFNIIWAHGGQFITQTLELAKQFPDVVFICEGDDVVTDAPANYWHIDRNFHTSFYALGYLAALATETGKIGYVAGLTMPFTYAEFHAIEKAVQDAGVDAKVYPVWAGDFNDPTKARQLTDTLISEGCDVIIGSLNLGMLGLFESVKAADTKVLATAKYTDKSAFAPDNYMTSVLYDFSVPLQTIVSKIMEGETSGYYPLEYNAGFTIQTPIKNVPEDVAGQLDKLIAGYEDGSLVIEKDFTPVE